MKKIFHILNRGVEGRKIFLNQRDYLRFSYNLFDFNTSRNVFSYNYRRNSDVRRRNKNEDKLIDILCWTLMPNHIHTMAQENAEKSTGDFSRKIFDGYTKYFNIKNERKGVLFQGKTKKILIKRDSHFLYLPFYIFANPLDLFQPTWREGGVKNPREAFEFLKNYKWSALNDLIGIPNFPEIINKRLFFELYDTDEKQFKKEFLDWLGDYRKELYLNDFE